MKYRALLIPWSLLSSIFNESKSQPGDIAQGLVSPQTRIEEAPPGTEYQPEILERTRLHVSRAASRTFSTR